MKILAAIRREQRKLEKQGAKIQRQLQGLTAAAKALGNSAGKELDKAEKRVMSAAARAKISRAAGARKAVS
jgi:peptidoglycan hydrolase CwlO-like protein